MAKIGVEAVAAVAAVAAALAEQISSIYRVKRQANDGGPLHCGDLLVVDVEDVEGLGEILQWEVVYIMRK